MALVTTLENGGGLWTLGDHDVPVSSSVAANVPLLWGMLIWERLSMYGGRGVHGKSLKLPLNFAMNLKVL